MMTLNKFYVTKEIAEKLRAKGYIMDVHYENELNINQVYSINNLIMYKLPRIDEVLAWLREVKKIHIMIDIWKVDLNDTIYRWGYDLVDLTTTHVLGCDTQCADNYEQAGVAGIEYCLDNLI